MTAAFSAPLNLLDKAVAKDASAVRAEAPRKRYHLGSVPGTPFQHLYLPASLETGTVCFPQYTIYRSKPNARGQRIELPQPGAYHDLTDEDVKCLIVSCANRIVRWDATRTRPKVMHRNSRGFRPSTGAEGEPMDEPLKNYVYLEEEKTDATGMPKAGGLFAPIVFAPIAASAPERAEAPRAETPAERQEGAAVAEAEAVARPGGVAQKAGQKAAKGVVAAGGRGADGYRELDASVLPKG